MAATPSLHTGPGTMVQVLLLCLLAIFAQPSRPTPDRPARATFSRPPPRKAAAESLYAFDCLAQLEKTRVFGSGQRRGKCPDNSKIHINLEHKVWDVFQLRQTEDVDLLSCKMEISRFEGSCGMFDHFAWDAPPHVSVPQKLSVRECQQLHEERVLTWGDQRFPIKIGTNSISATVDGSLRYDPKSATVVCTGTLAHLERGSKDMVEESLTFEHISLTLRRERGRKLLTADRTLIVTTGEHHGVQWTTQEVARGGAQLDTVTFIVDGQGTEGPPKCPLAILRNKLKMTRLTRGDSPQSALVTPRSVNFSDPKIQVKAVVWTNSELAVHQLEPIDLPAQCGTSSTFFRTNHQNIIISPDTSDQTLKNIQNNALDYLSLSGIAEASRNDLIHAHVESLFANFSRQINALECARFYEEVHGNDAPAEDQVRVRYLEAGEVVFRLICPRVEVTPGPLEGPTGSDPVCTKQMPVHLSSAGKRRGRNKGTLYLEASSRYLMSSSKVLPCSVHSLAPTVYETNSGNFIFYNGSDVQYLKAEVRDKQELRRKFNEVELFDINKDSEMTGLESSQQMEQSGLFMEYSRFLEVTSRADLAGAPSVQQAKTSGGERVHSWWVQAHALSSDLSQEALAAVGMSWIVKTYRMIGEVFRALHPLASLGGLTYFFAAVLSCASKIFRLILVLYSRPGESLKKALRLSLSSQSRNQEYMDEQVTRLLDQRLSESVGTEMAVIRARMRQEAE